jgi:hypothetical protein
MKTSFAAWGLCALFAVSNVASAQQPSTTNQTYGASVPAQKVAAPKATSWSLTDQASTPAPVATGAAATSVPANSAGIGTNWASAGCDAGGGAGCDAGGWAGCDSGCDSNNYLFRGRRLGSCIQPSEGCFDGFISPISNPVFFEDPRNVTEARFIFLNHTLPAGVGGGDVQLYALQLRARLSENVSLIATKDGYATSSSPLVDDGWADVSAGLKFGLLRDPQRQSLLSAGFTFEVPTGSERTLQGNGDGELNLFLTGGKRFGDRNYWISTGGWRQPMNHDDESTVGYWSNHFSRQLTQRFYALTEFNWYHWMGAGTGGVPGVEGLDLFNLGSSGVAGNDIVTQAAGIKFKPNRHQEIGAAYEFPLTDRRDILENRLNFNWIFRY